MHKKTAAPAAAIFSHSNTLDPTPESPSTLSTNELNRRVSLWFVALFFPKPDSLYPIPYISPFTPITASDAIVTRATFPVSPLSSPMSTS